MIIDPIPIPELPPALARRFLLLRSQAISFLDVELEKRPHNAEAAVRRGKYIADLPELEWISSGYQGQDGTVLLSQGG